MTKQFWLLKTEPTCWSWAQQVASKVTEWDGVRNFQAQKHMRSMQKGDAAFFYHTGKERQVVGVVNIISTAHPDTTDPKFVSVDVKTAAAFKQPVTLARIKDDPRLQSLPLIKQGRLSVVPIDAASFDLIQSWGMETNASTIKAAN